MRSVSDIAVGHGHTMGMMFDDDIHAAKAIHFPLCCSVAHT